MRVGEPEPLPFSARPFRLHMGVRPLDVADWLERDRFHGADLALKAEILDAHHELVVRVVDAPAARGASEELWSLVSGAVDPALVASVPEGIDAIEACGRVTQEDWVLMVDDERPDGPPILGAACVCFPTRWVLAEKVGLPLAAIHEPVAFYDEQLAGPVDRFMERLAVDRPVWRMNWNLMDDPRMFQPVRRIDAALDSSITAENAGERVWLRVERQTLRRLPETGAVAFGIKVRQETVAELGARRGADALATLRVAVAELPAATVAYKGIGAFSVALDEWLRARSS